MEDFPQSANPGADEAVDHMSRRRALGVLGLALVSGAAVACSGPGKSRSTRNQDPQLGGSQALPGELDPNKAVNLLEGTWNMPGATMLAPKQGLQVIPTGRALVKQQHYPETAESVLGPNSYIPIPTVNLYGTHVKLGEGNNNSQGTNFGIEMAVAASGEGTLHFFARPPWLLDERVVQPPGFSITISNTELTVHGWTEEHWQGQQAVDSEGAEQGQDAPPDITHSIALTESVNPARIAFIRTGEQVSISVEGGRNIQIPNGGQVFGNSGEVWFGADVTPDSTLTVSELTAYAANDGSTIEAVDTSTTELSELAGGGLQALADRKRSDLGLQPVKIMTAIELTPLVAVPQVKEVIGQNFGGLTTELDAKWQMLEPKEGVVTPQEADAIADIASRAGRDLHLHAGAFEEAMPAWARERFLSDEPIEQKQTLLEEYITTWVSHFNKSGHTTASIDVVNEILDDNQNFREGPLYKALGESYVPTAFRAARRASPDALLFLNEYGLESGTPERWDNFINLLEGWLAHGVPIDGIGFQAHVFEEGDAIDGNELAARFEQLKELGKKYGIKGGLKVRISEASVERDNGDNFQEQQYKILAKTLMEAENGVAYCIWGPATAPWYFTAGPGDNGNDAPSDYSNNVIEFNRGWKGIQEGIAAAAA